MWHGGLNHEVSIGGEMTCRVLEAADLVVSGEEIKDGVEDQIHQPIALAGCGDTHVTDRNIDPIAARFGTEPFNHMGESSMPST